MPILVGHARIRVPKDGSVGRLVWLEPLPPVFWRTQLVAQRFHENETGKKERLINCSTSITNQGCMNLCFAQMHFFFFFKAFPRKEEEEKKNCEARYNSAQEGRFNTCQIYLNQKISNFFLSRKKKNPWDAELLQHSCVWQPRREFSVIFKNNKKIAWST